MALLGTSLHRFVEVGASDWRWLPRAGLVDVDMLRIAREQTFERNAVNHGRAGPLAFGIRLHRREWVLDLLYSTVFVVGVAVFCSYFFLFCAGARMDVRQVHRPRTGKSKDLQHDLHTTIGLREGRCSRRLRAVRWL